MGSPRPVAHRLWAQVEIIKFQTASGLGSHVSYVSVKLSGSREQASYDHTAFLFHRIPFHILTSQSDPQ